MNESEKMPSGFLGSSDGLRELIIENPELPLLVFVSEDANSGEYSREACNDVSAYVGEVLDCRQEVNEGRLFEDRRDFEEELGWNVEVEMREAGIFPTTEEIDAEVKRRTSEYEPYWKKCIIISCD